MAADEAHNTLFFSQNYMPPMIQTNPCRIRSRKIMKYEQKNSIENQISYFSDFFKNNKNCTYVEYDYPFLFCSNFPEEKTELRSGETSAL